MKRPSLKQQFKDIKKAARKSGLSVRKDNRLKKTAYRAMNPRAAKLLKQPCPPHALTYDPRLDDTLREKVLDVRHELIEHKEIGKLSRKGVSKSLRYPRAHRVANRKQRTIGAEDD